MFERYVGGAGGLLSRGTQDRIRLVGAYLIAFLMTVFVLTPLYLMIVVAFQSPATLFSGGTLTLLPSHLSLVNFTTLLRTTTTPTYFVNSAIITTGTVVLSTILGVIGGYGLSRFTFPGKGILGRLILFTYMISPIILAIPLYIIFYNLQLLNTYIAVILAITAISAPFSIWLMWEYFQNIPITYEESAWISGAGRWRTVRDIVLPLARPGYITVAIFAFAVAWNDYTMAKIVLNEQSLYPITVGSSIFLKSPTIGWGETMAVALLISLPPFFIALFLQNYLLQGFNLSHR
jgi:multiple sugar transport system permease protein